MLVMLVEAHAHNVVPMVGGVAAPALLDRGIPLPRESLINHLKVPHQVTGRGRVALGADARPWRGMPEARHVPGHYAMAHRTTVTKEGLMAIDMTGGTSNLGVQHGMFHP